LILGIYKNSKNNKENIQNTELNTIKNDYFIYASMFTHKNILFYDFGKL